jgi:3-dehydroquinate dehydratase-2
MKHKIIVINGPNLNLLGEREKDKYGNVTLKQIEKKCKEFGEKKDILVTFKQSNIEGKIVDFIQQSRKKFHGLVINAGGYTHTSVAIRDALAVLTIPIVELHITNIYNREDFRHKSLISNIARSIICGFGPQGYILALQGLKEIIKDENR